MDASEEQTMTAQRGTGRPSSGRTFEGRPLARPDEPLVDQGAAFDMQTLMTRRSMLRLVGVGVGAAAVVAAGGVGRVAAATAEIPEETAGPYPGDGSNGPDVLDRSGVVRRDIRGNIGGGSIAQGVPLRVTFTITDLAKGGVPFAGAALYAWQCDAQGRYSMYSAGVEDDTFLRGVQVANDQGRVTFLTIVPGCYPGRWPHIHFEVYPNRRAISSAGNAIATSQLAVPKAPLSSVYAMSAYSGSAQSLSRLSLDTDMVFADDDAGQQLATMRGSTRTGYVASLAVPVDTRTRPAASRARSR
jgi:protocatechuate 3,4-dioxygenase beta subunit